MDDRDEKVDCHQVDALSDSDTATHEQRHPAGQVMDDLIARDNDWLRALLLKEYPVVKAARELAAEHDRGEMDITHLFEALEKAIADLDGKEAK